MVPWLGGVEPRQRLEVEIQPGLTRVHDLLRILGVADSYQSALLVVIDGRSCGLGQVLNGGEEIQLLSAISGG